MWVVGNRRRWWDSAFPPSTQGSTGHPSTLAFPWDLQTVPGHEWHWCYDPAFLSACTGSQQVKGLTLDHVARVTEEGWSPWGLAAALGTPGDYGAWCVHDVTTPRVPPGRQVLGQTDKASGREVSLGQSAPSRN